MKPAASDRQAIRFSLRRMFIAFTVVSVVVGLLVGGVRWINSKVMDIGREAARYRIIESGSDTPYDRELLGAEVDELKAEYQKRKNEPPVTSGRP
jgi:hypothetical protein